MVRHSIACFADLGAQPSSQNADTEPLARKRVGATARQA